MEEFTIDNNRCFCCGADNDRGLKLKFEYPAKGKACTGLVIPAYFSGWKNMTHGGLLSMLLDEAMAHACGSGGRYGVTAALEVRFLKPVNTGETIRIEGELLEIRSKLLVATGLITDESGEAIARGRGRFIAMNKGDVQAC